MIPGNTGGKKFMDFTRPESITVKLQCKYGSNGWTDVSGDTNMTALLGDYESVKTISAENWETAFENLPVKINPAGTPTANGTAYTIDYRVKETSSPAGYSQANDGYDIPDSEGSVTLKNTLDTRDITVNKEWETYGNDTLKYDIDVTLKCETIGYSETQIISTDMRSVTFEDLPEYDSNNTELVYTVSEKVSGSSS